MRMQLTLQESVKSVCGFVIQSICGTTIEVALSDVVYDFNDEGLDAIHNYGASKTLLIV